MFRTLYRNAGGLRQGCGGLGLFIAKTLIERSGAQLSLTNAVDPSTGAVVRIGWFRTLYRNAGGLRQGCGAPRSRVSEAFDLPLENVSWTRHIFEREVKGLRNPAAGGAAPLTQAPGVPI
jgi:two-component system sensor histidine kinase RegB